MKMDMTRISKKLHNKLKYHENEKEKCSEKKIRKSQQSNTHISDEYFIM